MKEHRVRFLWNILMGFGIPAFILGACATRIPVEVRRPPALDTAGIQRIAIMPFETTFRDSVYRRTAQYATNAASAKIRELNHFTLVNSSEIDRLRRNNQNIENYVDALFGGQITRLSSNQSVSQSQYKNKDGTTTTVISYNTSVELEFTYFFTRARDMSLIGPVTKGGSKSVSSESGYVSPDSLYAAIVDEQLRYLYQDIIPYTVTQSRTMAAETSKDKTLKALMKDTLALVKGGNYRAALDSYLGIYGRYRSVAAAENAAILYEALGNTQAAADLMRKVSLETGSPVADSTLSRLNQILRDQQEAAAFTETMAASQSRTETVAAYAGAEIRKVLPPDARVWIVNASGGNAIAEAVVDNLTSDFITRKIGVVDRQNRSLIEAEHRFQVSGNVSDNDFVSIGNLAGADTIVTVGISGAGAARRLQIRVLDIEKGVPIMQSDTGNNWQL